MTLDELISRLKDLHTEQAYLERQIKAISETKEILINDYIKSIKQLNPIQ